MIRILAIGKKHEPWVDIGIERYEQRLKKPYDISWELLEHSSLSEHQARIEESARLLERIKPSDTVILLDEIGDSFTSPALAMLLERQFTNSKQLVLVIGGAYGVDDRLRERADVMWSLSELVFPHQLVRLIVTEQLYRMQEINRGGHYHHE